MPDQRRDVRFAVLPAGTRRRVLISVTAALCLLVGAALTYAGYLRHLVTSNVVQADLLPTSPASLSAQSQPPHSSEEPAASAPLKVSGAGMNVLLIGSDTDTVGGGRSDVIMLVHISEDRSRVCLIHFPRDLYVSIPGHGQTKINAAYAYGGAQLLVATVQNLLDIAVDHVVMTGFEGFKGMTDAVGGVDVVVTEPSTSAGYTFRTGTMHMDGEMSLAFVRERKQLSGGDVSRGQRQQEFVKALMLKSLAPGTLANPVQAARFIDAATRHLTVDRSLGVDRMRSLAMSLVTVRQGDICMLTAPFTGFANLPGVGSVELVDMPRMRALGGALRADRLSDYPG